MRSFEVESETSSTSGINKLFAGLLRPLDRFFNKIFSSKYNPLYRSGTIAVTLLVTALVSGLYLLFFYRVGSPYESMEAITTNAWGSNWVRSLHLYSADAALVMILFHVLRMLAQGKTWGPRTLAWVSGVGLTLGFFLTAWTGFVLVWDSQGQALATAAAKILDRSGLFADPIQRSFDGAMGDPPSSFFFMILFLHIVLPLALIFLLWIHTSKLARPTWFPAKKMLGGLVGVLAASAILMPFPLADKADLLSVLDRSPINWLYNFWIPASFKDPASVLWAWALAVAFLVSVPFWLKPKGSRRLPKAFNDPNLCQGCGQCVSDCPYEAIEMIPRPEGTVGSEEVALVDPSICVSCGLCSASCEPFTMGLSGRKGSDQFAHARAFARASRDSKAQMLIISCTRQKGVYGAIEKYVQNQNGVRVYPVDCAGTLHLGPMEQLVRAHNKVVIAACPERNCVNKDGIMLLRERINGVREPTFSPLVDGNHVKVCEVGEGEVKAFLGQMNLGKPVGSRLRRTLSLGMRIACSLLLLGVISWGTQRPGIVDTAESYLRLSWRVTSQTRKTCTERSAEEIQSLPRHMRTSEVCSYSPVDYELIVSLNGQTFLSETVRSGGLRNDRPIYVIREIALDPDHYDLEISFKPLGDGTENLLHLAYKGSIGIKAGEVALIHLPPDGEGLELAR